jgi:secondary thiamine-phosphate synthase enzyme
LEPLLQAQHVLTVEPPRRGLIEITGEIAGWVEGQRIHCGLLTVFVTHTSASLLIQENADPAVQRDLEAFFDKLAPDGAPLFTHRAEGPDDMPAHVKGALTQTHLAIPVRDGKLTLGIWQGIYLFEHRQRPRPRDLILHLVGA